MKKALIIIFILFNGIIFYQMLLGKNGFLASYQTENERKILQEYINTLEKRKVENNNYIKYLSRNREAYRELANDMGFFKDKTKLIRFKNGQATNIFDDSLLDEEFKRRLKENEEDSKVRQIRIAVSVLFYLFFGFFIILIIFSGQNDGSEPRGVERDFSEPVE